MRIEVLHLTKNFLPPQNKFLATPLIKGTEQCLVGTYTCDSGTVNAYLLIVIIIITNSLGDVKGQLCVRGHSEVNKTTKPTIIGMWAVLLQRKPAGSVRPHLTAPDWAVPTPLSSKYC